MDKDESKAKLKVLRSELLSIKRDMKILKRREANRELALALREGYSRAGKIMLAKRAGKMSAERQRGLGWPNLQKAWKAAK